MSVSEKIRELANNGVGTAEIARRLGIRYQHAYNVFKSGVNQMAVPKSVRSEGAPSFVNALVLVSCVSQKLSQPSAARLLYQSDWFIKVRNLVESQNANWLIMSALYGIVEPSTCIAPYERTLNTMGISDRRTWADKTRKQLDPHLACIRRIVIFAGQRYREFLEPALRRDGYEVEVPMKNLRIGEQLSWLTGQK